MGGGAFETGAAADGIGMDEPGSGMDEPGSGGALALGGVEIWPISGTTLGTAAMVGLLPSVEVGGALSSFKARPICTTASTHSVPMAIIEARSRSEARMVDGGVTSC
jgi:hypothetical protein